MNDNILHQCEKCKEFKPETDFLQWAVRENKQKFCKVCRRSIRYEMRKVSGYFSRYYNNEEIKERRKSQSKKYWADLKADPVKRAEYRKNLTERRKQQSLIHIFKHLYGKFRQNEKVVIQPIEWYRLAKKQRCKCALTGRKLSRDNISVDHILPKSKGGKTELVNLRFVVREANLAKWTQTDQELLQLAQDIVGHIGGNRA